MRQAIVFYFDTLTMGANDLRAGRASCADALPEHAAASYRMGWERAFALACQRPDAAVILPQHFSQER